MRVTMPANHALRKNVLRASDTYFVRTSARRARRHRRAKRSVTDSSASALLAMIYSATADFQRYVGEAETASLQRKLEAMLAPQELNRLRQPRSVFSGQLGANVAPSPRAAARPRNESLYDRRNELLREIEGLEQRSARSNFEEAALRRARADLDSVLNELFAGR
jgi:hypothetical protein